MMSFDVVLVGAQAIVLVVNLAQLAKCPHGATDLIRKTRMGAPDFTHCSDRTAQGPHALFVVVVSVFGI